MRVMRGYVAVEADDAQKESAGGIILTEKSKEDVHKGTVVAVGEGEFLQSGAQLNNQVSVGDRVCYKPYQTHEVEVLWTEASMDVGETTYDRTLLIIKESELLLAE